MTEPRPSPQGGGVPQVAIYTVCDARFFLGLVALVNSLRLQGHRERIFVVDCGLTESQRAALANEVTLLPAPEGKAPHLLKYAGPMQAPAEIMLLLDADLIVTRPLQPLIELAQGGKIVAFSDVLEDRHFESWREIFGLAELRGQPYVNSGLLVMPRALGLELLSLLESGREKVDVDETMLGSDRPDYPLFFLDQDVLNAMLASVIRGEDQLVLDKKLAPHPPFRGVTIADAVAVRCLYPDGSAPYVLHHVLQQKPWLAVTRPTLYSRLLPRLWLASDLAVRLQAHDVPLRFRGGPLAAADRSRATVVAGLRKARGRLGLRSYLRSRRRDRDRARLRMDRA